MKPRNLSAILLLAVAATAPVLLVSSRDASVQPAAQAARTAPRLNPGKGLDHYLAIRITEDQRTQGLAEAKRAVVLSTERQDSAALAAYDRAVQLLPNLGDWLALFAAGVAATQGDTAEVTRRLEGLDSLLLLDWGWRTRVRAYRNAQDLKGALQLAEVAAHAAGSARRRSEGWRAVGEIRVEQKDTAGARAAFTQSMDVLRNSDIALESARQLSELGGLDALQQLRIGRVYLRFGNQERALKGLQAYLSSSQAHPDTSARVRFELGRMHFNDGRYRDANRVLAAITKDAPPAVAAEALYLAGRAQYRLDRTTESRQTFMSVATRFPSEPAGARAFFMLADLDHDAMALERAEQFYRRAISTGPGSEAAGMSYMRLALLALGRGDRAEAIRILEEYRTAYPNGARHQQASYWAGRIYLDLGDRATAAARLNEARAYDPFASYGVMAARRLQQPVLPTGLAPDPVTPEPGKTLVAAALLRLVLLDEIAWPEAAAFELQRMRRYFDPDPAALFALAEGLNAGGRVASGIGLGKELQAAQPMSRRLLKIIFPLAYSELILPAARQHSIDPYFVVALIRQESAFNPRATSAAGAMGLMQVMPATARSLAPRLGIRRFNSSMLHDPAINVRIGARHLADVIDSWKGRTDYVLAAYNAGSTRVLRWQRFTEARDPELFMERIPFEETRDYVRVVQLNARIYEALYGSGATPDSTLN